MMGKAATKWVMRVRDVELHRTVRENLSPILLHPSATAGRWKRRLVRNLLPSGSDGLMSGFERTPVGLCGDRVVWAEPATAR